MSMKGKWLILDINISCPAAVRVDISFSLSHKVTQLKIIFIQKRSSEYYFKLQSTYNTAKD